MNHSKSVRRAARAGLLFGVAGLAVLSGQSSQSFAQAQQDAAETRLDEIVVTGSRIARPALDNNVPTVVVSEEELKVQGFENLADMFTSLPNVSPSYGTSRTQSTFSGAATSGLNTVNLRNLEENRSLVLINGRRVPSGDVNDSAVDLNTIPTANIERIEMLTGGASAIYGADAVAGVINIITKKDFNGAQINLSYGESTKGDNKNPSGSAMIGGSNDKGYFLFTAQYDYQGKVSCADREICSEDFAWFPPAAPTRGPAAYSAVAPQGRFFVDGGNGLAAASFTSRNGSFTDGTGALIPFVVATDGYNRNPRRTLAIPTTRKMFAFEGEYIYNDYVQAFFEMNYGSSETNAPLEGHPFQSTPSDLIGGVVEPTIPVDNPFIPAALRARMVAAGDTALTWSQRFDAFGLRGATNERQTTRFVGGLKGEFDSPTGVGDNWNWELSYTYGRTTLDSVTPGLVSRQAVFSGLRVEPNPAAPGTFRCVDPVARSQGCVPINPFAPYTQAMIDYLSVKAGQRGAHQLDNVVGYVTGSLFDLPAGPVGIVIGGEYRTTSGFLDYDDPINRGVVTGNQVGDTNFIKIKTTEAFGELIVPILSDQPFAKSLTAEGAIRFSDTKNIDKYETWKFGGEWAPIEDIRLRAMRARAVRAPVAGDLSGTFETAGVVNDPCTASRRNANPTRAANCAAAGVPANYAPPLAVEQQVRGFVGANPNLKPEVGDTLTFGAVLTPSFVDNLTITIDRFQIDLDGAVNQVGRQLKANACYDRGAFCADVIRGANPAVPGANYVLVAVNDQVSNVAEYDINGVDLDVSYAFDLADLGGASTDYGSLNLRLAMTFYTNADYLPVVGETPFDLLGFAGGSTSDQGWVKRTGSLGINYAYEQFGLNWTTRYISKAGMSPFAAATFPKIGDAWYHSVQLRYDVNEKTSVNLGVSNLFNRKPPFFATGTSGTQALDTVPGLYDIFGRQIYAGITANF
ncbi:MAG: TonB-dependent receptor [Rhodospirillaceae bacterium]|nr:TonB-dependent receptor [Rhodospirillaceae bacterium]